MWDEASIAEELRKAGFISIRRCEFGDADDGMFAQVEDPGRFKDQSLNLRELAIEVRKPGVHTEKDRTVSSARLQQCRPTDAITMAGHDAPEQARHTS